MNNHTTHQDSVFQLRMTYEEWDSVHDNPIQRDTERHAGLAQKKHLAESNISQSIVSAAQLPSGDLVKLDGHTRSYLWSLGKLEKPSSFLTVNVFKVESIDEAIKLYKTFDNASAAEDSVDRLQGAFRLVGFYPRSESLRKGGITGALKIISDLTQKASKFEIYETIPVWIESIKKLDQVAGSFQVWTVPIIAAALITHKIYGDDVLDFWSAYSKNLGSKSGSIRCPVQALRELIEIKKVSRQNLGRANHIDILSKSISCVEKWRANESYTAGIKPTDLKPYLIKKGLVEAQ